MSRQQITVAEKRAKKGGKPEFEYLLGPDAPFEGHRQKFKEFKRARESREYATIGVYERVKEIQLRAPKEKPAPVTATADPKAKATTHHESHPVKHHEKHR